jgi:hypothetical protein
LSQPWASDTDIDGLCEQVLLASGEPEEAYARYAISANRAPTYLGWFRAVAKKYPDKPSGVVLADLVRHTPGEEGKWFAAAKDAKLFDEAVALANATPCDPKTLTRAARDFAQTNPAFAIEAGLAALRWLVQGYSYEITSANVWAAYSHTTKAAATVDGGHDIRRRIPRTRRQRGCPRRLRREHHRARAGAALTWLLSRGDNRHVAVCFARLCDADLDIVSESREELHQALGGKRAGPTAHEIRDVRLRNTEDLPGLCLGQLPRADGADNLQRQIRLQQLLVRVGQACGDRRISP